MKIFIIKSDWIASPIYPLCYKTNEEAQSKIDELMESDKDDGILEAYGITYKIIQLTLA